MPSDQNAVNTTDLAGNDGTRRSSEGGHHFGLLAVLEDIRVIEAGTTHDADAKLGVRLLEDAEFGFHSRFHRDVCIRDARLQAIEPICSIGIGAVAKAVVQRSCAKTKCRASSSIRQDAPAS